MSDPFSDEDEPMKKHPFAWIMRLWRGATRPASDQGDMSSAWNKAQTLARLAREHAQIKDEIARAIKQKKTRKHLYARLEAIQNERMKIEGER